MLSAFVIGLVALGSAAWAGDPPSRDGYMWLGLSRNQKVLLVSDAMLMSDGIDTLRMGMDWDMGGTTFGAELTVGRIVDEIGAAFARGCEKDTSLAFVLTVYFVERLKDVRWEMLRPEEEEPETQAPGPDALWYLSGVPRRQTRCRARVAMTCWYDVKSYLEKATWQSPRSR
jgi:hypothetical protein